VHLLLTIAALFLAFYAWRRARRIDALEERLRALEAELQSRHAEPRALPPPFPQAGEGAVDRAGTWPPPGSAEGEREEEALREPGAGEVRPVPGLPAPVGESIRPDAAAPHAAREPGADERGPVADERGAKIDWERWLGVRGAAVLGGVVLALAGIFLFRYSIEHGWIPPWLRVVGGLVAGAGCIVAAERWLRRAYAGTADAVEGGGVVVLYASTWAARVLYGLIGTPAAFVAMIAITAACCALSWRHASLVIALLGLTGGFATPFLLSSGVDNPIGLFAYVFLLDLALLQLARRRRWPLLGLLSLAATAVYLFAWIAWRMTPERAALGLVLLGISAAVFALAGRGDEEEGGEQPWVAIQAAGVLLPFGFILYIASSAALSPRLLPLALLTLTLAAGAAWLARALRVAWLGLAAASASLAVVGVWSAARVLSTPLAWEVAGTSVALALVFHLAAWSSGRSAAAVGDERERGFPPHAGAEDPPPLWATSTPAALVANLGFFWLLLVLGQGRLEQGPWPWIAASFALAAMLAHHAGLPRRAWLQVVAAVALAIALANGALALPERAGWALLLATGVALQFLPLLRRAELRPWAEHAAAAFAAVALLGLSRQATASPELAPFGLATGLGLSVLMALAGARLGRGEWLLAAVALGAFSQFDWLLRVGAPRPRAALLLALELGAVLAHAALPFAAGARLRRDLWAWPAAALAGAAWFLTLRVLWLQAFGDAAIGLLPIALGALAAAQGRRAASLWAPDEPARARNLVWFFAAAIGFVTLAIPLQLEKSWITIAWALEGVGLILLWRRFDVVWLKVVGVALLLAVTVRLIANPAVLGYYPRPSWRIVNWLFYTYLVPAAAMLVGAQVLRRLEIERARPWESGWYARGRPLGAVLLGFAGMLAIFVWLNLAIADWFSAGTSLEVSLARMPARDLAMSITWALYALALLAAGVRLRSVGVRWVSLGLMIVTIAKVFLYDLGELTDLYRVASLLGLAVSLIAVSLAYQRFVLRSAEEG